MNVRALLAAAAAACLLAPGSVRAQTAGSNVQQVAFGEPGQRMVLAIWQPEPRGANAGKLPLVVISHGTGAGPLAHVDTAQALAAAGFVVAAPMHRGDNFQDESAVGRPEWMPGRSRDVTAVIDYMLREWPGRERLDPDRIGLFGFSAGGTTALISIGGVPDLARVGAHCAARPEFVCKLMAVQAGQAAASAPRMTRDLRIAAAVVAAPGLGFAFEPAGLDSVTVPVQLWAGGGDLTVPYESNAGAVRRLLRDRAEFHNVEDAVHLSFLAPCGPESPPQLCEDKPGFDRSAFHREFNRSVVDFFRKHLRAGGSSAK